MEGVLKKIEGVNGKAKSLQPSLDKKCDACICLEDLQEIKQPAETIYNIP